MTSFGTIFFGVKFLRRFFVDTVPLFVALVAIVAIVGIIIGVALVVTAVVIVVAVVVVVVVAVAYDGNVQDEFTIISEDVLQQIELPSIRFVKLLLLLLLLTNFGVIVEAELVT
ncbi:hypothetical protein LOAG_17441 [Loa loa]|uniref:Uncharacterized protein n=1 Tax=Loa loa TaxID=7209 RepID=A0A1S0UIJ0_LOALO|nr:hypothetical protein LOAG_17441 [Loa loa]EJD75395.1 hypothetical protein LOAG_17441 [Loa loa]